MESYKPESHHYDNIAYDDPAWPKDAHPPGYHSYFQGIPFARQIDPEIGKVWKEKMGMTPRHFMMSLFDTDKVRPGEGTVSLETDRRGMSTLSLSVGLLDPADQRRIGTLKRDFEFHEGEAPEVYHKHFHLEPSAQGGGIAKDLLANSIKLYDEAGIRKVTMFAGLQVGGYAWAKYGFRPASARDARELLEDVEDRLGAMAGVPAPARRTVERLVQSGDPKAIWAISDLEGVRGARRGHETTLGKALLLGTCWRGVLDLEDPQARARFDQYVHKTEGEKP